MNFFTEDYLSKHFAKKNYKLLELINSRRINENIPPFDQNDISKHTLVNISFCLYFFNMNRPTINKAYCIFKNTDEFLNETKTLNSDL